MSSWGRFWPSGRYSPFAPAPSNVPPTITDADYSYLGPDDIVDPPSSRRNDGYAFHPPHRTTRADSDVPDILVLKHKGTIYPLHFNAYAIADGAITVGDIRRLASKETKTDDPRRIKLLYKGRKLRDDDRPCRDEGLKQQSEIMCVVESTPFPSGHRDTVESSPSASEDEMLENGIGGPRIDVDGSIRDDGMGRRKRKGHRGGRRKKPTTPHDSSSYLAPSSSEIPHERSHSPPRAPSPGPARPSTSPQPPPQQAPTPQPHKPKTPREILDALSSQFHTEFVPQCIQYMSNPPSDTKARDFEYKKLSETILAQILLKLDAVETEGDETLRTKRKELVKETQLMLSKLDQVGKS
ncbi:MAG: hypothetical protein LQ342_008538 [Letrouitia transgressa]|nr:MAG: hypothetical protein LQ342_008538 [Letrouitia transgressa]